MHADSLWFTASQPMVSSLSLLTQAMPYEHGWEMHRMWSWGWGIGMMAMMFLFWAVVIVIAVLGIRWLLGQRKQPSSDTALEILRERFARG